MIIARELKPELAKYHLSWLKNCPSRAERPLARAKSELSRAELNSVATLVTKYSA